MTATSASGRFLPTRRKALALGLGAAGLLAAPAIVRAEAPYKRALRLQSLNSGEKLTVTYWTDWRYRRGNGVQPGSFHMRGMAMDIAQDFLDPEEVYRVAKKLGKGGAGFYPTKTP